MFETEGAEFEIDDELRSIPPFDEDCEENEPATVARFRATVAAADAVLVATPEYNSSIPGELKNALDWLSRPLAANPIRNKPVAVIGASTGAFGAVWAQAELRKVLATMGARVVEGEVAIGHVAERFDAHGRLNDPNLEEQLGEVVREFDRRSSRPRSTCVRHLRQLVELTKVGDRSTRNWWPLVMRAAGIRP